MSYWSLVPLTNLCIILSKSLQMSLMTVSKPAVQQTALPTDKATAFPLLETVISGNCKAPLSLTTSFCSSVGVGNLI